MNADTRQLNKGARVEPDRERPEHAHSSEHEKHTDELSARHEQASRPSRSDSATITGNDDAPADKAQSLDKIETAEKDKDDSDDHTFNLVETVQHAAQSAKRKIYLHHRHNKDLSKQFTAGSAQRHLSIPGPHVHDEEKADLEEEQPPSSVLQNLWVMCTTFPYWNMAFWSGWCYSIGSAMFVIDGCWSWVPQVWPETEFPGESKYGVPLWFFFGACLYQIGGVMAYLEAVNDGCFAGAAMKRLLKGHVDVERELLDAKLHTFFGHIVPHHHHDDETHDENLDGGWTSIQKKDTPEAVYAEAKGHVERRGGVDHGPTEQGEVREYLTWRWWPTWHAFRTYHIFEVGYVACAIQLFGVTLYGVTSIVILPGILDSLEWWQELGAYWVPQVVASVCFLVASIMFTIMAQDRWYKPKYREVSWWIGIWAQVGSVGFLLCAIFGLYSNDHTWAEYQSSLSSLWGSFFYMLSGLFQWYESINTNVGPVLAFPNNRTPVLLRRHKSEAL